MMVDWGREEQGSPIARGVIIYLRVPARVQHPAIPVASLLICRHPITSPPILTMKLKYQQPTRKEKKLAQQQVCH